MMTLHPEAVAKGQEELDRVVGRDRLPEISDQVNLSYIGAILKEVLRWQPALPLGNLFYDQRTEPNLIALPRSHPTSDVKR